MDVFAVGIYLILSYWRYTIRDIYEVMNVKIEISMLTLKTKGGV